MFGLPEPKIHKTAKQNQFKQPVYYFLLFFNHMVIEFISEVKNVSFFLVTNKFHHGFEL